MGTHETEMNPEIDTAGWLGKIRHIASPNFDDRPTGMVIDLLVIHNISLPPGEFAGDGVIALFTNQLDPTTHPYYQTIRDLRVSAHFFIRRDGERIQFVALDKRAWHAGVSNWNERERCNDFSIGIELEGCDETPFTEAQYGSLVDLIEQIRKIYPITDIVGHSDIAPGRKTDPGPRFDWARIRPPGPKSPNRSA